MAGMTEMMAQARERQELVVAFAGDVKAAAADVQAALKEIRLVRDEIRQAGQEIDMLEFKLRQSYEKLDKVITSEAQRFGQWAFFKMGVLAGCVGGFAGVLFFLLVVLGLREALVVLGLR